MTDYARKYERKRDGKTWIEARSYEKDLRRAAEKELGPLSGRQWEKVRRQFRTFAKVPDTA